MAADPRMRAASLLLAGSIVYMISAIVACNDKENTCKKEFAWAVVFSVIGTFISLVTILARCFIGPDSMVTFEGGIVVFLFLWWLVAACVGTFRGPFETTGNGYFSAWASFIFAAMYAYECSSYMREAVDKGVNAVSGRTENQASVDTWGAQPAASATTVKVDATPA